MYRKNEPCRNFQRGSCQYGDQCKFLHVTQRQSKSNPLGFGSQAGSQSQNINQQQQKSNPFGFGVQSNSQPKGASDVSAKYQNQFKPGENKWTRSLNDANSNRSRPADNKAQVANHNCTDPESCKRQIAEDFEHERPLWKLTCYGHFKNRPCDISGDISYEELRAVAYDDAKQGLSLQSIVEKERNLLNSKLVEFENLLRNPYVTSSISIPSGPNANLVSNPNSSPATGQSNFPPSLSSFSQLGASLNLGSGTRPSVPSNNTFGQSNAFQSFSQTSSGVGVNSFAFGTKGPSSSPQTMQQFGNASGPNISSFTNSGMNGERNPFSLSSAASSPFPSSESNQSTFLTNVSSFSSNAIGQAFLDVHSADSTANNVAGDDGIWLKEWNIGEIPEEAPPTKYCV